MSKFRLNSTSTTRIHVGGANVGPDGIAVQLSITGTNSAVLAINTAPPGAAQSLSNAAYLNASLVSQAAGTAITSSGLAYLTPAQAANDVYLVLTATSGEVIVRVTPSNRGGPDGALRPEDMQAGFFGANLGELTGSIFPGVVRAEDMGDDFVRHPNAAGVGAEMGHDNGSVYFQGYNPTTELTVPVYVSGSTVGFQVSDDTTYSQPLMAHADGSVTRLARGVVTNVAGAAQSETDLIKSVTAIANNSATALATVTVPNAAHSCTIEARVVGSLGAGGAIGANEASASNTYTFTIARTAGVAAVVTASSAYGASASAVAGAATVTATLAASSVSGAVGATNTFTINGTIARSGGSSANHTALLHVRVLNANTAGVTIA